ncbi:transposase [Streptosporangium canum]|uniref:transposase n=1 Tax=Streptosporangium canum TaxID=324952 RepID=UPI0033AC0381
MSTAITDLLFCEETKITTMAAGSGMTGAPLRAGVVSTSSSAMARTAEFRAGRYGCLPACADALFELTAAVLSAPTITSLPYLSPEPVFRRSRGSLYDALTHGRIDAGRVRELLIARGPRHWPLTFALDASTHPRPYAETNPGREWHHLSGPGVDGGVPRWAWQHLVQLNLDHDSWVAPMDVLRVPTGGPAQTPAAVEQIRAMTARLRAVGRREHKLFVHDAGYDLAVLAYELHG